MPANLKPFLPLSDAELLSLTTRRDRVRDHSLWHSTAEEIKRAYLSGVRDFENVELNCADLSNTTLRGASFKGAHLGRADFSNADLRDTDFISAWLRRATLENVDAHDSTFDYASLGYAFLLGANFGGASLHGRRWNGVSCPA